MFLAFCALLLQDTTGPSFLIDFQGCEALAAEDATVRLVETVRGRGVAGEIEVEVGPDGGVVLQPLLDREWSWHCLQGEPPWRIQYTLQEYEPDSSYRAFLELGTETGDLLGQVATDEQLGRDIESAWLQSMAPRGCIVGVVKVVAGSLEFPLVDGTVLLVPRGKSEARAETIVWYETHTDKNGEFSLERLPQGPATLFAYCSPSTVVTRVPLVRREIEVIAGTRQTLHIEMPEPQLDGSIQLGFLDIKPRDHGRILLRAELSELTGVGKAWINSDGYERARPEHRVLSLHGLPLGKLRVTQIGLEGPPRTRPYSFEVDGPFEDLYQEPIRESTRFGFQVVDSHTGEEITGFDVVFGPRGQLFVNDASQAQKTSWELPPDVSLQWILWKSGYAIALGDESAFEGGIARVALEPGWGTVLFLRAGNPNKFAEHAGQWNGWTFPAANSMVGLLAAAPIPNASVFADDLLVGRSDVHGEVPIQLPVCPRRLTIRSDGWRVVGVDSEPSLEEAPRYVVWLEPDILDL